MRTMTPAQKVALVILCEIGPTSLRKLHALLFYAQAWSLAWHGEALFEEPIYAAHYGPQVRSVTEDWLRRIRVGMRRSRRRSRALQVRCREWTRRQIQRHGRAGVVRMNVPGGWSDGDAVAQLWGLAHGGMIT